MKLSTKKLLIIGMTLGLVMGSAGCASQTPPAATEDEAAAAMVIDTGHDLMITEPELTVDMLLNAAK